MRHDHIEAILHKEDRETESEQDVVRETWVYIHIQCNRVHRKHIMLMFIIICVSLYGACVSGCYLVVHDCSQTHDAHMHIIFLAHETGVFDGFAV